ncbi:hypothetical protein [Patiriisocius sp. Uisw_017]|jgi:type I restriction enzyme M protein
MRQENLNEFIELYNGKNINKRKETWSEENEMADGENTVMMK